MRRFILSFFFLFGVVLFMGAAFLLIDASISPEMRSAARGTLDAVEQGEGKGQKARRAERAMAATRSFDRGVFFSSELELAAVLPPAPDGWQALDYDTSYGERITGEVFENTQIASNATQCLLHRFANNKTEADTGALRVYAKDDMMVAVRLEADRADLRMLEQGTPSQIAKLLRPARALTKGPILLSVDGITLHLRPRESETVMGKLHLASYTHLAFGIGSIVVGEVFSNAPDIELIGLLSGLDIGAAQMHFPAFTNRYAPSRHATVRN